MTDIEYITGNAEFFNGVDINNASKHLPLPFKLQISENQNNIKKGKALEPNEDIARFTNEDGKELLVKATKHNGKITKIAYMTPDRKNLAVWEQDTKDVLSIASNGTAAFIAMAGKHESIVFTNIKQPFPNFSVHSIEDDKGLITHCILHSKGISESGKEIKRIASPNELKEWLDNPNISSNEEKSAINGYKYINADYIEEINKINFKNPQQTFEFAESKLEHFQLIPNVSYLARNTNNLKQNRF